MVMPLLDKLDFPLDVPGQEPSLYKLYTQISFAFANHHGHSHADTIDTLTRGLQRLTKAFPWLDGRIVRDDTASDGALHRLRSRESSREPLLTVRDHRSDKAKAFRALQEAKWPISMLDETWLCPRNTLGMLDEETGAEVFLVQASLIEGGVIVSFVGQHNVMDMAGLAEVIRLFDQACRDEPFTDQDLESGNSIFKNRLPLLGDDWIPDATADRYLVKTQDHAVPDELGSAGASESVAHWRYFEFPAGSLTKLKAEGMKSKNDMVEYITTDDALSALIWRSTCRARAVRTSTDWDSTLARAIDGRPFTGMPARFPGLNTNLAYADASYSQLKDAPIGEIASKLRLALKPETLSYSMRVLATLMSRAADKSKISVTANLDLSKSIALSSWSKYNLCNFDFSLGLGVPEVVRRPGFSPVEGLMYLMPHTREGSIAAAICLRDEDMERLRLDEEFGRFALYIG